MKKTFILLKASIIVLMLTFISFKASAQFSGPTNASPATPPPALATDVGKIICAGGTISLSATTPNSASTYVWRKKNSLGAWVVVPGTTVANTTYSETPAATLASVGYYLYTVEEINSNGCSTTSSPITVFVLPPLAPVIAGAIPFCEAGQGSASLTITGLVAGYSYNYQWTRNTVNVGTNLPTYTVTEPNAGTFTYGVTVTFDLSTGLTAPCAYTNTIPMVVNPLPTPTITIN
jgi:hypothetical protein